MVASYTKRDVLSLHTYAPEERNVQTESPDAKSSSRETHRLRRRPQTGLHNMRFSTTYNEEFCAPGVEVRGSKFRNVAPITVEDLQAAHTGKPTRSNLTGGNVPLSIRAGASPTARRGMIHTAAKEAGMRPRTSLAGSLPRFDAHEQPPGTQRSQASGRSDAPSSQRVMAQFPIEWLPQMAQIRSLGLGADIAIAHALVACNGDTDAATMRLAAQQHRKRPNPNFGASTTMQLVEQRRAEGAKHGTYPTASTQRHDRASSALSQRCPKRAPAKPHSEVPLRSSIGTPQGCLNTNNVNKRLRQYRVAQAMAALDPSDLGSLEQAAHRLGRASAALRRREQGHMAAPTFSTQVEPLANTRPPPMPPQGHQARTRLTEEKHTARHTYTFSGPQGGWRSLPKKGVPYEPKRAEGFLGPAVYRGFGTEGGNEVDPSAPYPVAGYTTLGSGARAVATKVDADTNLRGPVMMFMS